MVARPSSLPLASLTTATTAPLVTLAVPETSTGELIGLLPSGLSMMIRSPLAMGVAEVLGSDEVPGDAAALVPPDALGEAAPDVDGEPLDRTNVVLLSPPHPASSRLTAMITAAPIPFTTWSTTPLSNGYAW